MVLSSLRCGCNAVVGCGPAKPPSRGNIPGNSGDDMSKIRYYQKSLAKSENLPNRIPNSLGQEDLGNRKKLLGGRMGAI
jgi:hypothetical protein